MLSPRCVGWAGLLLLLGGGCTDELPPLPEALIIVDTDALVPRLVDRLRIDIYTPDGAWIESRDLPRRFSGDWPTSFSVYGRHEDEGRTVLVRLRAYTDGHVRDYRGERFTPRADEGGDPAELLQWASPPPGEEPRLVRDGRDITPESEPLPELAIDRLVLVELRPGERKAHRVELRGACFGTMVDLAARSTCTEEENERAPAVPEPTTTDLLRVSRQGEFGAPRPCKISPRAGGQRSDGTPLYDDEVCVSGGAFFLGGPVAAGALNFADASLPERVAVVSPFVVDRFEVTVARWRQAREEGFAHPYDPTSNDAPLPTGGPISYPQFCTYSDTPLALQNRESYPVNCLGWDDARAFCQFYGADLLTEAQWEYAASATGDGVESLYPWGNGEPTCDTHLYGRPVAGTPGGFCAERGVGPAPVGAGSGDETPLGVRDMGGSMGEWMLDSARPYASRCWAAAPLVDPLCWEEAVSHRSVRGGSWNSSSFEMLSSARPAPWIVTRLIVHIGFRCARPGGEES